MCRLLPRSHGLPRFPGGSASASSLSRPPQASRALRPAGLLNRPRRPLSRGSSPVSCPARPLVSYQSNRQLSGWNPPPLAIRAVGAHWGIRAKTRGFNLEDTHLIDPDRIGTLLAVLAVAFAFAHATGDTVSGCLDRDSRLGPPVEVCAG